MKRSSLILPLPLLIAAHTAAGVVFYSGYQNLIVPLTLDGVYLNPVTGATAASHPSDWNTSPWINPFFGGVYIASSDLLRPVVIGANEIVNLPAGTLVDGTDNFPAGESGSATHAGPGAGQFQLGTPGFIGFEYQSSVGGPERYGWLNVTINNTGPGSIRDWAYDDADAGSIRVGLVHQSAPLFGAQTFTLSPGLGEDFTLGSAITDSGGNINSLVKTGLGRATLGTANSFTGTTTVDAGTLEAAVAGALGQTASITVNGGGTLLLTSTADQVSDSAPVTLAGGTLRGNGNGLDENLGTLTLSASSVIDFGAFASGLILRFDDSSALPWTGLALSVWNWTAGLDRLYVGTDPSGLLASQLSKINFYTDSGTTLAGAFGGAYNTMATFDGLNGEVSVVPIPEPSSVLVATSLLGLLGWRERRREQHHRRTQRGG